MHSNCDDGYGQRRVREENSFKHAAVQEKSWLFKFKISNYFIISFQVISSQGYVSSRVKKTEGYLLLELSVGLLQDGDVGSQFVHPFLQRFFLLLQLLSVLHHPTVLVCQCLQCFARLWNTKPTMKSSDNTAVHQLVKSKEMIKYNYTEHFKTSSRCSKLLWYVPYQSSPWGGPARLTRC